MFVCKILPHSSEHKYLFLLIYFEKSIIPGPEIISLVTRVHPWNFSTVVNKVELTVRSSRSSETYIAVIYEFWIIRMFRELDANKIEREKNIIDISPHV